MTLVQIKNNKVINLVSAISIQSMNGYPCEPGTYFEEYDPSIHPWGPGGECGIEIGAGWKDKLKEKIGYCIFCGDHAVTPETSGSL